VGKVQQTEGPYWSKAWIQKLWEFTNQNFVDFDSGAVDFAALGKEEYEFRKAMFFRNFKNSKRAKESFYEAKELYEKRVKAGEQGGRPRIPPDAATGNTADDSKAPPSGKPGSERPAGGRTANSLQRNRRPESKEDFRHFVADQDLNISLAEDWYAIHEARGWTFEDGSKIMNWKGALKNYVASREEDGMKL